jgi:hypothetical protein
MTNRLIHNALLGVFMMGQMLTGSTVFAEPLNDNWQFFAEIHADLRSDLDPKSNQDASDASAGVGVLYTRDFAHAKFLGEAFASDDEGDIQRLKLGWKVNENHTLWMGRFYNPLGYWNVHYSHNTYFSPSIHRPSLVEYEEKGGILPMHISGLLLQGKTLLGGHKLGYHLAAGEGPELNDKGKLEPVDIIKTGSNEHDTSLAARISLIQEGASPSEAGIFVNRTTIPAQLGSITEVKQKIFGAFYYANWSPWRAIWSLYTVTNKVKQSGSEQEGSFSGGYAQFVYTINHLWTAYARIENVQSVSNDPYLSLFPDFIIDRNLGGLRLSFRKNQSLSFEIQDSKLAEGSHMHTSVQWSANFE